ncbi:MAG TPA: fibronectin type III domain-containing protein [bacterium]|nr:fibronectin type III domain-containing protein [bacterium]HPR87896.1 fibronectin type III domain-containing protein [bacterium]
MIEYARVVRSGIGRGERERYLAGRVGAVSLVLALLVLAAPGFAGGLLVTWDANTESDLAGYRIYYGVAPSVYPEMVDVGNVTSYTIQNLTEGQTYYLVVTAYDRSGNESLPSTEVTASVTAAEVYLTLTSTGIQVYWTALAGADLYRVYASSDPYFTPATPVAESTTSSFTESVNYKAVPFARYYLVQALSGGMVLHTFDRIGVFSRGLRKGQNLVSMPLVPADNSLKSVLGTQLNGAANAGQADKILSWNGSDYEIAWLVEGTSTAYDGKWMTQAGDQESSLKLDPDHSFWVVLRSTSVDTVLTFTGKVSCAANREIAIAPGPNFIGSCYPVALSLAQSELASDGVAIGSSSSGKSDKLMRWIGNKYEVAWLVGGTGTAWDGTWLNESGSAATSIQFNPGVGYVLWVKGTNAATTWSYPNPKQNL